MSDQLRHWQRSCIDAALKQFESTPHFFCQATPGAGKTRMAAELANRLIQLRKIDLVICFAPSCQVVEGFRATFASVIGRRVDGRIGAVGAALTYQAMEHKEESFWQLLDDHRVLVVFDEIHHCAGNDPLLSNAWGHQILIRIMDKAAFTLALSGTPWRSDDRAIALARYTSPDGTLICDYRYGLKEAIENGVCRSPRIVLLDNRRVKLTEELRGDTSDRLFPSIANLLGESAVTYESLLRHEEVISQLLDLACRKLDSVRLANPNAAGLVVATDIEHAHQIGKALKDRGQECKIVTNRTPDAQAVISTFRHSECAWIIAVGMISEGTDIPRLQVCCYLSRIRTELHYRQVLGRVLRRIGDTDEHAWLFMLAEPKLQGFAERISEDLPEDLAVLNSVAMRAIPPVEQCGFSAGLDNSVWSVSSGDALKKKPRATPTAAIVSVAIFPPEPIYKVTFSEHYKQQLLACF